jgi:hypothetical protein
VAQTFIGGVVVEGYRVASGPSKDYPYGTLEKQFPIFKRLGLDLDNFFLGTLNISIAPLSFEMVNPEYTLRQVAWTDLHPPEDFSFSRCTLRFKGIEHPGLVYYPHPETKLRHFEGNSLLEVLCEFIPGIHYGVLLEVSLNPQEIVIRAKP